MSRNGNKTRKNSFWPNKTTKQNNNNKKEYGKPHAVSTPFNLRIMESSPSYTPTDGPCMPPPLKHHKMTLVSSIFLDCRIFLLCHYIQHIHKHTHKHIFNCFIWIGVAQRYFRQHSNKSNMLENTKWMEVDRNEQ